MKKKNGARDRVPFWRQPRFRYGSVSTLILCLCVAALTALVYLCDTLEKKSSWRVDFSFNELTTQSETTQAILDSLPYDVHIYALFTSGSEDLPLMELLNRYAAASDRVTWEQTSVTLNPTLTTRFRGTSDQPLTNDSLIVSCEATGRYKILSPDSFISLSLDYEGRGVRNRRAYLREGDHLRHCLRDPEDIPRVMILQGHGGAGPGHHRRAGGLS